MSIKSVVFTPRRGVLLGFNPTTQETSWSRDTDKKDVDLALTFTREQALEVARAISSVVLTRPNLSGLDLVPKALIEDIW